ncbi:MAG TPA: hypothetical protein VHF50_07240 [Solirubrobacterales bacterium]|nr:hypothetical protein [Solirubrobacterales bacterium]
MRRATISAFLLNCRICPTEGEGALTARLTALLVGLLAITMFAAGCGGDDDTSGSEPLATSSLSKAAYVKKAGSICTRGLEGIRFYEVPPKFKSEAEKMEARIDRAVVPSFGKMEEELRALGAPKGDEKQIEAYLDALDAEIGSARQRSGSISSFTQLEAVFRPSAELARRYGIDSCAFSNPASG